MPKLVKLHRSTKNRVVAGVLGGIAEYFGWSPTILRWLFALSIPLTAMVTLGGSVFVYLLLWLVMPNAKTDSYERGVAQAISVDADFREIR